MTNNAEQIACAPEPLREDGFNPNAELPYELQIEHIRAAMNGFLEFLGFINQQLYSREMQRIETMVMPANFSSIVGEFMAASIPRYCTALAKHHYHNGQPDLIPAGMFKNNAVQSTHYGIEIKASRYARGWQRHNPETVSSSAFLG